MAEIQSLFDAAAGFGGMRQSGYGRDGGKEGFQEYSQEKWKKEKQQKAGASEAFVFAEADLSRFGATLADRPKLIGAAGGAAAGTPETDNSGLVKDLVFFNAHFASN